MNKFVPYLVAITIATTATAANAVILSYFDLGLNTFDDQLDFSLTKAVRADQQIDWMELVLSNHLEGVQIGGAAGNTEIRYRIYNGEPGDRDIDIDVTVPGDGVFDLLGSPYTVTEDRIFFDVRHVGDTINASTEIELNVFVSQVPEPCAAMTLAVGGALSLCRRRARRRR